MRHADPGDSWIEALLGIKRHLRRDREGRVKSNVGGIQDSEDSRIVRAMPKTNPLQTCFIIIMKASSVWPDAFHVPSVPRLKSLPTDCKHHIYHELVTVLILARAREDQRKLWSARQFDNANLVLVLYLNRE